ncbi:hypothetical protein [uncultured Dysosmobacter sp.]|uniref:hypothetical protein n=1 Tax=uncultured Dysosmobacter sp. TaxID=2591384 RepID=UPI002635164C|nr:hypothetical protein [uncultured Dysosmobacter sp.]
MDELMALNRPEPAEAMPASTRIQTHPTEEEWADLLDLLAQLEQHTETQTVLLRTLSNQMTGLPAQEQGPILFM